MKKLSGIFATLFVSCVLIQNQSNAQIEKPWQITKAYFSANAGSGNALGISLHFTNRWAGIITKESGKLKAKNLPINYRTGTSSFLFFSFEERKPQDSYNTYTISAGRVLTKQTNKAWVMITGGLSVCNYTLNEFTRKQTTDLSDDPFMMLFGFSGTSSNYATKKVEKTGFGASLGLQANVNLFRFMGLGGGANVQLHTAAVIPSAWLGLNVGLMRPAKHKILKPKA